MIGDFIGLIIMFGLGFLAGAFTVINDNKTINEAYTAIAECESTLPRDQTCKYVITAEVAE